jgi:transposase
MEKLAVILASEKISDADWEKTPDSIKRLIGKLLGSEERLREQLGANSQNTSKPPSSDQGKKLKKKPKKSGKSRGGQIGHPGQERKLYELSECLEVHHHLPDCCSKCGSGISTIELNPYRHQIVELPEIKPLVTEHRFYQGECSCCGSLTRDWDSDLVNRGGYGARLIGQIA